MITAVGLATSITGAVEFGSAAQRTHDTLNSNRDYRTTVNTK